MLRSVLRPIVLLLILSVIGNIWLVCLFWNKNSERSDVFPLLSPRIFSEKQNDILVNFLPLRKALRAATIGYGESFGICFEYLPSGTSIGINEKKDFIAASLIKVPVVMAYFRQREASGLSVDGETIRLEERDIDKDYGTLWQKGVGAVIAVDDAVRLSLVESDNTASLVLANRVLQTYFDDVYEGLDIDFTKVDNRVILSPKQYASILKELYLSSVISKESSQKILTLLTQTKYNDNISAGVPAGIPVAHKFGIYEEKGVYQDCGIVYAPKRPYVLCMMSQSSEAEARTRMIAVSRMIYEYVAQANHVRK